MARVKTILLIALVATAVVFGACAHSEKPTRYGKSFSYGLRHDKSVYFLLDYQVSRARSPVWFIMPIERSPLVLFHEIYLYRYEPTSGHLERLATLHDSPSRGVNVGDSKFIKDGDVFVFAYRAGFDEEYRLLYEIRQWDIAERRLRDVGPKIAGTRDSALYQRYFGDYSSPAVANPGVVGISKLIREILADVEDSAWDLPRKW